MNETRRGRCGHKLTSGKSIVRGYGPTCARKIRNAAKSLEGFKPAQVEKAAELIFDQAFAFLHSGRALRVAASNGVDQYLTSQSACNCPAGLRGRQCYHVAAARIISAA